MTLEVWKTTEVKSTTQVPCQRSACIMFYASDDCLLCDAAWQVLLEAVSDLGLEASIVEKVDINECPPEDLPPTKNFMLPIIRTCDRDLSGFPDIDTVRTAIMQAMVNCCFSMLVATCNR